MSTLVGTRRKLTSAALVCAVALLVTACGGGGDDARPEGLPSSTTVAADVPSSTPPSAPPADPHRSLVATATGDAIDVYADVSAPDPHRRITVGEVTSAEGIPITLLVRSEADDRLEVLLPVRPNGSTGWVDRAAVELSTVRHRVEVSLSEYRMRVYVADEVIVDEPVGVGRADRPTPGGEYFLKELLQPAHPGGVYGPYAYGLSGYSNVLDSFAGGDAVIGIHGTNEPHRIGTDVSSGCIRVHNDVIRRLVEEVGLPLGTPVEILP